MTLQIVSYFMRIHANPAEINDNLIINWFRDAVNVFHKPIMSFIVIEQFFNTIHILTLDSILTSTKIINNMLYR